MNIRILQKEFAEVIEKAKKQVHIDKEDLFNMLAKQFGHSSKLPAMLKFIEGNKNNWDKETYDLAKWYYEDVADTYGYYHKYEMSSSVFSKQDIKQLCVEKQKLVKIRSRTKDSKEIKKIDDRISAIKQQVMKAKADLMRDSQ